MRLFAESVVDRPFVGKPAPDHGEVGFSHVARFELPGDPCRRFGRKREEDDARRGAIQPVNGVNPPADPIAKKLKQVPRVT